MSNKQNSIIEEDTYERKEQELFFAFEEARNEIQISLESVADIIQRVLDEEEIKVLKKFL